MKVNGLSTLKSNPVECESWYFPSHTTLHTEGHICSTVSLLGCVRTWSCEITSVLKHFDLLYGRHVSFGDFWNFEGPFLVPSYGNVLTSLVYKESVLRLSSVRFPF